MRNITNTADVRTWILDWFENRFSITRECVESSTKVTDVSCFDLVDRYFLEYDVETDFDIRVPEGTFDDCDTLDGIIKAITKLKGA